MTPRLVKRDMGESAEVMEGVGAYLRRERERHGLSLEEVSSQTRIQRGHLEAIERDDFAALPAGPFVTGFITTYARVLGLKPEVVLAMMPQEEEDPSALVAEHSEPDRRVPRMEIRELPVGGRDRSWLAWSAFLLVLLLVAGGVTAWRLPAVRAWLGLGVVDRLADAVTNVVPAVSGAASAGKTAHTGSSPAAKPTSTTTAGAATSPGAGSRTAAAGAGAKAADPKAGDTAEEPTGEGSSTAASAGSSAVVTKSGVATNPEGGKSASAGASSAAAAAGATGGAGPTADSGRAAGSLGGIQRLSSIESENDKQAYQVYTNPGRAAGKPQVVNVSAQSKTYLRVSSSLDGPAVYEGVLKGGDRKEFQSQNDLWIIIGNGGGVEVYFDGHPLPTPGRYGERVGLAFRIAASQ